MVPRMPEVKISRKIIVSNKIGNSYGIAKSKYKTLKIKNLKSRRNNCFQRFRYSRVLKKLIDSNYKIMGSLKSEDLVS